MINLRKFFRKLFKKEAPKVKEESKGTFTIKFKNGSPITLKSLKGADLENADLRNADLRGASLIDADLRGADLRGADLRGAYLRSANLKGANLRRADLIGAYLSGANLRGAYLENANLRNADLFNANLKNAKLPTFLIVPEEGEFIAYKKVRDMITEKRVILTLQILEDSKRVNKIAGRKCRVSKCIPIYAEDLEGNQVNETIFNSGHDPSFKYEIGKEVEVIDFDDDIRIECTRGIHCFITKKEAREY